MLSWSQMTSGTECGADMTPGLLETLTWRLKMESTQKSKEMDLVWSMNQVSPKHFNLHEPTCYLMFKPIWEKCTVLCNNKSKMTHILKTYFFTNLSSPRNSEFV